MSEAYAYQMTIDTSWKESGKLDLQFKGCSGSQLVDIVQGRQQLKQAGNPTFVVMTVGGKNARLAAIINACIYRANPAGNYGPAFHADPNGEGTCKKALFEARNYIDKSLGSDLISTLDGIFAYASEQRNPEFWLYVTGYAHFFNTDTNDCDDWTFQVFIDPFTDRETNVAFLRKSLRSEMNNLMEDFLTVYVSQIYTQNNQ
jgi:hypothetical protein